MVVWAVQRSASTQDHVLRTYPTVAACLCKGPTATTQHLPLLQPPQIWVFPVCQEQWQKAACSMWDCPLLLHGVSAQSAPPGPCVLPCVVLEHLSLPQAGVGVCWAWCPQHLPCPFCWRALEGLSCEKSPSAGQAPAAFPAAGVAQTPPLSRYQPCMSRFTPAPVKFSHVLHSPLPCWTPPHRVPPTGPARGWPFRSTQVILFCGWGMETRCLIQMEKWFILLGST